MDVWLRTAEQIFRRVLAEKGRDAPGLVEVEVEARNYNDDYVLFARFSDRSTFSAVISRMVLARCERSTLSHNADFFHACHNLYSRLYEDHVIDIDLQRQREQLDELYRQDAPRELLHYVTEQLRVREQHAREAHRRSAPPARYLGFDVAVDYALPDNAWAFASRQTSTATEVQLRSQEAARRLGTRIDDLILSQMYAMVGGFGDVSTKEAQERGLALLTQNLSAEQRQQYETSKHFIVKGGDTGKRYRINHGRQMNIEEIDKNGARVKGLCFLPQGGLVAGDVMLAQKIALELYEKQALAVANPF